MDESPHIPETMNDLLQVPVPGHFVTVRPDGFPDASPWWFIYDGENLKVTHNRTHRFFENLSTNPKVALVINDPEQPYRYLEIRGEVVAIDDDESGEFYSDLTEKYLAERKEPSFRENRVVLTVKPNYTTSYAGSMGARKGETAA